MDPKLLWLGLIWFGVFVLSTTLHEAAHALVAWRLGDDTAYRGGQVSLNPIPHIRREPIGMVVVPILSFFLNRGGWMIGWASAPYDASWAARHPRRAAWMALAGPTANLLLVIVAAIGIRIGLATEAFVPPLDPDFTHVTEATGGGLGATLALLLSVTFSLNLVLCVFNLLPLPPLDGAGALPLILPREEQAVRWLHFSNNPTFAMIGLVLAWTFFGTLFRPVYIAALNALYAGIESYSYGF